MNTYKRNAFDYYYDEHSKCLVLTYNGYDVDSASYANKPHDMQKAFKMLREHYLRLVKKGQQNGQKTC